MHTKSASGPVLPTKYYSGDHIEKTKVSGACSTHGKRKGAYGVFVGQPEGNRPLGRHRLRWEDNIMMDLQEMRWGVVHGLD
jgi:hypothetical protein